MAASVAALSDPLHCLRLSIAGSRSPITTITSEPTSAADTEPDLAKATHVHFNNNDGHQSFPLDAPTRFTSNGKPVDLRSVLFAWQKKDAPIPEYLTSTQQITEQLNAPGRPGGSVQNLNFVEKLELVTWLSGEVDDSDHIKPLDSDVVAAQAGGSADIASGSAGGIAPVTTATTGVKGSRTVDPRLQEIYNGERRMGDRNSILRGIKPTDFSHVRKHADTFLRNTRVKPGQPTPAANPTTTNSPALVSNLKKPGRRLEPIILLSPSASSLLRMSNIKSFLENGVYIPSDSTTAGSSAGATILHLMRTLPSIDPSRPFRFILVDTPDQFKPDYWQRVVAVFTTGQTWQFKPYKWQNAPELFSHCLGVYVGWTGEDIPQTVKGWGRGVLTVSVDKWNPQTGSQGRWRDREVVENIWIALEQSMRSHGWTKEGLRV